MDHIELMDAQRDYNLVATTIRLMEKHQHPCILGGGWAVYAHAPSIPSIDVDLYLDGGIPDHIEVLV